MSIDEELADFDEMIIAAGISTPIRASPERTVLKRLCPKSYLPWSRRDTHDLDWNPEGRRKPVY
jgi:hypothetical protein